MKECRSLASHYDVHFIVADGLGDELKDEVHIHDIGLRQSSRLKRARIDSRKALEKALSLNCNLYHFHDPELVRVGVKLKKKGKYIIYDVHEDLPRQIYYKPYLPKIFMGMVSRLVEWQENKAAKQMDYIVTATPYIAKRFKAINAHALAVNNFPILHELRSNRPMQKRSICYTGGITEERGLRNIVEAMASVDGKLILAGAPDSQQFLEELKALDGWKKVEYRGLVDRKELANIMAESIMGLVLFLAYPNHMNAQPNKIFEYMSAGIAVMGSNFPLWKEIIEDNQCGICVNPADASMIAKRINEALDQEQSLVQMGENGKKSVRNKYNWNQEENKLLSIYKEILE